MSAPDKIDVDMRMGVLFQHGALFSALTVLENVMVPMREYLDLAPRLMGELARFKLSLVGLQPESAGTFPLAAFRRHDQARRPGAGAGA